MGITDFWQEINTKPSWGRDQLRALGDKMGVTTSRSNISTPDDIRVGDVFSSVFTAHPALIISVNEDSVTAVVMSTKEATHSIYQIKSSRFFRGNYITYTIINHTIEGARAKYLGYMDNKGEIKHIMKLLKAKYKQVLSLRPPKKPTFFPLPEINEASFEEMH